MYKLLPILLFVFILSATESDVDTIWNDNNSKIGKGLKYFNELDISAQNKFFEEIIEKKITQLINPQLFQLSVTFNSQIAGELQFQMNFYADGTAKPLKITSDLTSEQVNVRIYIDKSIYSDDIHKTIIEIIKLADVGLANCDDCIKIESVVIDDYISQNNNIQLSLNREDIYDDSWAVIIGIDKYKYSKQLNYAVKDAEAVKNMLINKFDFPEDNIKYLVNEEATLSEIKLALDDISTSADENDRILIFYSGHGETIQGIDGTEKGYIIPYEGKQKKAYATGLAMDEILTISMLSKSKHMLFLMDACYSGLMTQQFKGLAKPTEEGYLTKVANESARQIITAGGKDEQVIERDEWQHSAFTKNLLEGLETWEADYNQDGCITADELSSYLREHVTEDSDFLQTPQDGRFRNSGGGEFVFFSTNNSVTPIIATETGVEIPIEFEKINILKKNIKSNFSSELLYGEIYNWHSATSIGYRFGYWANRSISFGLEGRLIVNPERGMQIYRYHTFLSLHLKKFKYFHPYITATIGQQSGYWQHEDGEGIWDNNVLGLSFRFGLASDFKNFQYAIETGGSTTIRDRDALDGSEFNIIYKLNHPNFDDIPDYYSISLGYKYFYPLGEPYYPVGIDAHYESLKNIEVLIAVKIDGNIKEYNLGFFDSKIISPECQPQENIVETSLEFCDYNNYYSKFGFWNFGYSWHLNNHYYLSDYVILSPGVQLFLAIDEFEFLVPAISLGMGSKYRYRNIAPLIKSQLFVTYSIPNRKIILGSTFTFGLQYYF